MIIKFYPCVCKWNGTFYFPFSKGWCFLLYIRIAGVVCEEIMVTTNNPCLLCNDMCTNSIHFTSIISGMSRFRWSVLPRIYYYYVYKIISLYKYYKHGENQKIHFNAYDKKKCFLKLVSTVWWMFLIDYRNFIIRL